MSCHNPESNGVAGLKKISLRHYCVDILICRKYFSIKFPIHISKYLNDFSNFKNFLT